jgi:hypothetical protein
MYVPFSDDLTREAFNDALAYLDEVGIFVPDFRLRIISSVGGSYVTGTGKTMCLGRFPTRHYADWFSMHELAHILVFHHDPCTNKRFAQHFGEPQPDNYNDQQKKSILLSVARPKGYASIYARDGGGEEAFAELVAYMYTRPKAFRDKPPRDLATAWRIAWTHGLARMTE